MASEPNELTWEAHRNPYPRLIGPGTVLCLPSHISDAELLAWIKVADYLNALEARATRVEAERDDANKRIEAMEPFQSGWEDPDETIVGLEEKLARAEERLQVAVEGLKAIAFKHGPDDYFRDCTEVSTHAIAQDTLIKLDAD